MADLLPAMEEVAAATGFSGVVRVDRDDGIVLARAYGWADRAHQIPNTVATRFAIASGTKGLTALAVVRLIEQGHLELGTTARMLLGPDLPLISADVTVEHLLSHRSGIGDYVDETAISDITEYFLAVPTSRLTSTEGYLAVLGGHRAQSRPGARFSYCNSGYVVLALMAERCAGAPFSDLVEQEVCQPAGLRDTAFLRSDELPGDAAIGYLGGDGLRSNVLHLPALGSGDGGIYSTAADIHALWAALFAARVVSLSWLAEMTRPRSHVPSQSRRYGLGFWLHETGPAVMLEGYDAGVSFRTVHDPTTGYTHTVLANTTRGAWPVSRRLDDLLAP